MIKKMPSWFYKYKDFPFDCRKMTNHYLKRLKYTVGESENDIKVVYYIDKSEDYILPNGAKGACIPNHGSLYFGLYKIYDERNNDFTNRANFIKTLVHECLHLTRGFKDINNIPDSMNMISIKYFELDIDIQTILTIDKMKNMFTKKPYNIPEECINELLIHLKINAIEKLYILLNSSSNTTDMVIKSVPYNIRYMIENVLGTNLFKTIGDYLMSDVKDYGNYNQFVVKEDSNEKET